MAVTNKRSPGETDERVKERLDAAKALGLAIAEDDSVRRDVHAGKGFVNVNLLSGDGKTTLSHRLSVVDNTKDAGGGRKVGKPPFPNASVTAQAIVHKPKDKDAVMAVAPIIKGSGDQPVVDTGNVKYYKAVWDQRAGAFKQGAEITDFSGETGPRAQAAIDLLAHANNAGVTPAITGPNFNKGGTFEVGSAQPQPLNRRPTMSA